MTSDFSAFSSPPTMAAPPPPPGDGGAPPPPFVPIEPVTASRAITSLDGRARTAQVIVGLATAVFALGAVTNVLYARAIQGLQSGTTGLDSAVSIESTNVAVAVLSLIVLLGGGIATITWLYSLAKNTEQLRPGQLEHAPKWAIWGWFVPFLNFVRPLHMVNQCWFLTRSQSKLTDAPPPLLQRWWVAFICSGLIGRLASQGGIAPSFDQLIFNSYAGAVGNLVSVGAGVALVVVIGRLTDRHNKLVDETFGNQISIFE